MVNSLDDLVLHDDTRSKLNDYLSRPSHALMLTGPTGCGLGIIAKTLANRIAGANAIYIEPTQHNKQKTVIINADDIAELSTIVRDRRGNSSLAVVVDGADQTSAGVFERMLKLIEEPVVGVYYIFTAHSLDNIPATIMSRSSLIKVELPTSEQCLGLYRGCDATKAAQIKFIADRRPAQIIRLLADSEGDFERQSMLVSLAKEFLQGSVSRRLEIINEITEREVGVQYCNNLSKLLRVTSANKVANPHQLGARLDLIDKTATNLSATGNVKIQLTNLALNF